MRVDEFAVVAEEADPPLLTTLPLLLSEGLRKTPLWWLFVWLNRLEWPLRLGFPMGKVVVVGLVDILIVAVVGFGGIGFGVVLGL